MTSEQFMEWWSQKPASRASQPAFKAWVKVCYKRRWRYVPDIPEHERDEFIVIFTLLFG